MKVPFSKAIHEDLIYLKEILHTNEDLASMNYLAAS